MEEIKKNNLDEINFPEKWSLMQLGKLLQMDRRTIKERLDKRRVPFDNGPRNAKLYNLRKVLEVMFGPEPYDDDGLEENLPALDKEKLLMAAAKRKLAEIQLEEKLKKLIPIDEVLTAVSSEYSTVRNQIRGLPSKLAKHLANEMDPEKVANLLQGAIDEILSELRSDSQTQIESLVKVEDDKNVAEKPEQENNETQGEGEGE